MDDFFDAATRVFRLDEGERNYPYKDINGYWTIGRGHLIGKLLADLRISDNIINELFREDLAVAIKEARFVVGDAFFNKISDARKMALVSMLYTLGRNKFLKFEETIEAMLKEDWDTVAVRILQTKWAVDVDPKRRENLGRDDRIAYMFKTGEFHPDYGVDKCVKS